MTGRRRVPASRDDGTVLVLGIGLVALCAAVLFAAVDVAALHLRHRSAQLAADGAARAAAQALDLPAYYRSGATRPALVLDGAAARRRAETYLAEADDGRWRLADLHVEGDTVDVTVRGSVRLPFSGTWAPQGVDVGGSASAELAEVRGG